MSTSLRQKLQNQLREQQNQEILQLRALPKVPATYQPPLTQNHAKGKNQPICGNEAHCKATNNGYSRNALGGFFAH